MRITQDTLVKIAHDTAERRARGDRNLVAAYLCGSLLGDDHMLGGTTDIDLVFIHYDAISPEREIIPLTEEVHLDIAHHGQKEYRQGRQVRTHPWLGPTLKTCTVLHDPQHFMDFTQASVRGQYDRADHVFARARRLADQAREMWSGYQIRPTEPDPMAVAGYLRAVGYAANAIASLSGGPLTERRFLLHFPRRAAAVGRAGLYAGLLGLLGAPNIVTNTLGEWLPAWQAAYQAIPPNQAPARLHPERKLYYLRAFQALLSGAQPEAVLWPLLGTWTLAASLLEAASPELEAWRQAYTRLGLLEEAFSERLAALDAYLDLVDETLEQWALQHGA